MGSLPILFVTVFVLWNAGARADRVADTAAPATTGGSSVPLAKSMDEIKACAAKAQHPRAPNRQRPEQCGGPHQPPAPPPEKITFHQASPNDLPSNSLDGNLKDMIVALQKQKANCAHGSQTKEIQLGCKMVSRKEYCAQTVATMISIASKAKTYGDYVNQIKKGFDWYQSNGWNSPHKSGDRTFAKGDIQVTGYFAPAGIPARPGEDGPSDQFSYPIYRMPQGAVSMSAEKAKNPCVQCQDSEGHEITSNCYKVGDKYEPMPTRAEIDSGHALNGKTSVSGKPIVIAYVHDPIVAALNAIEGGYSLDMNGKKVYVNVAGQNGGRRTYLSAIVKCAGGTHEDYGSNSGIQNFFRQHQDQMYALGNLDETYIFFTTSTPNGIAGSGDLTVTAKHSIATDPSVIPTGAVALFSVAEDKKEGCFAATTTAVAQDTGGGIKQAHIDWYQGEGEAAGRVADNMNCAAKLFLAVPKGAGKPIAGCSTP